MAHRDRDRETTLGFMTALAHRQHGTFGGFLLLNDAGRPLEFHCTAPIKPNRAQEILYGPTLESYLYGELIGQTLFEKATQVPQFVYTDRPLILALRETIEVPLFLVGEPDSDSDIDLSGGKQIALGENSLLAHADFPQDAKSLPEQLAEFDLAEPFARIREAIKEAHLSQKKAA